jgi:uncharacterized small protein (DUF1192 family)
MPDCSPESLLRKVREGFQKRPDKFAKLHHVLFPKYPSKKIAQLNDEIYKIRAFYQKHSDSRRSDYSKVGMRPVPMHILYTGSSRKTMLAALPQHMADKIIANEAEIERLEAQHKHRQDRVPNIILKLCEKKKARFLAKHPEAIECSFLAFNARLRNTQRAAELRSALRGCDASSSTSDLESYISLTSSIANLSDGSSSNSSHTGLTLSDSDIDDEPPIAADEPTPQVVSSITQADTSTQTDSTHFTAISATQTDPLPQDQSAEQVSFLRLEVQRLRDQIDELIDDAERRGQFDNLNPQQSKEKKGALAKFFSMKKKK